MSMNLESYFETLSESEIRIQGTRIGIETVLYDHIHRARTPDDILRDYPHLRLDQIYAVLLYYYANRETVGAYLEAWLTESLRQQRAQDTALTPEVLRLRALRKQFQTERLADKVSDEQG